MTICNRSKLREDIIKLLDERDALGAQATTEFLTLEENNGANFPVLWAKLMEANNRFFDSKGDRTEIKKAFSALNRDEMLFLAKLIRYMMNKVSNEEMKQSPISEKVKIEKIDANGVSAEWQITPGAQSDKVLLYFHGGGCVIGSPKESRLFTVALGDITKFRVLSVDYRLSPEFPYPAAQEDCLNVYKWLLSSGFKPENIIIGGLSAGGYLTLSTLDRLKKFGIPFPAGAICLSPAVGWTYDEIGFYDNAETDPILTDTGLFTWCAPSHLAGADPDDPMVSPLYSDLTGFPPLLFQASTTEVLYIYSKIMVEKAKTAGVDTTFETWDNSIHAFHTFGLNKLPETEEAIRNIGNFVRKLVK